MLNLPNLREPMSSRRPLMLQLQAFMSSPTFQLLMAIMIMAGHIMADTTEDTTAIPLYPLALAFAAVADIIITTAVITAVVTPFITRADFRTQVVFIRAVSRGVLTA